MFGLKWAISCCVVVTLVRAVGLAGALGGIGVGQEDGPEPTVTKAEFKLVGDDGLIKGQVRYQYSLYLPGRTQPVYRKGIVQVKDVFKLPELSEPQGRIQLWVEFDDGKDRFHRGYLSFSYVSSGEETKKLPRIVMERCDVVTGRVESSTGAPAPGVLVVPMHHGQHGWLYPDWGAGVRTNSDGRYRLTGRSIQGLATRRANRVEDRFPFEDGIKRSDGVLKLSAGRILKLQFVDSNGQPVAGVKFEGTQSAKDGSLQLDVHPEKESLFFGKRGFEYETTMLEDLRGPGPHKIVLKRLTPIQGRVLGADGKPPKDCVVWVKPERGMLHTNYEKVDVDDDGKWTYFSWSMPAAVSICVLVDNTENFFATYRVEGVDDDLEPYLKDVDKLPGLPKSIEVRLSKRHDVSGKLTPGKLFQKHPRPVIATLTDTKNRIVRATLVRPNAAFVLVDVPNGRYEVQLSAFNVSESRHHYRAATEGLPARQLLNNLDVQRGKSVRMNVEVKGESVEVEPVRLTRVTLLPGSVGGVARTDKGVPLAHYFVYLSKGYNMDTAGGTHYLARGMTDNKGNFEVDGVIPGKYDVFVAKSPRGYGQTVASGRVKVESGKQATVNPRFGDDGRKSTDE